MESADETCDEQAGRIVHDDIDSNDDGGSYLTKDIPSSDMQPERARGSTVCWPSEAPSGLRLCAPSTTGSIYEFVQDDAEASDGIPAYTAEAHPQPTLSHTIQYPRKCAFVHLSHVC